MHLEVKDFTVLYDRAMVLNKVSLNVPGLFYSDARI